MSIPGKIPGSFFLLAIFALSCQKELDDNAGQPCSVAQINVFEGAAVNPVESYWYEYDTVTWQLKTITINIPPAQFYRRITVTKNGNNIDLGITGYLELDGAQRVSHMRINSPTPFIDTGDYFYGYVGSGFMNDRTYDHGVFEIEHTKFENDGQSLTSFNIGYGNDPPVISGNLSYTTTPKLQADFLIPYSDIFPELLPFNPIIKYGRLGTKALDKINVKYSYPGQPPVDLVFQNSNYRQDARSALVSFDNQISGPGLLVQRRYMITYTCD